VRPQVQFPGETIETRRAREYRARVADLRDQRQRIIAAADAERRRIERDLHDGAQQRLVALATMLSLAEARFKTDPERAAELVSRAREEAELAVKACKYPPQGIRSVGGIRTRLYGGPDYVQHANEEIAVIVQVEHIDAVKRARDILSVPGIDAYFVGPNDLCMSMGLPPSLEPDFPEFWEALDSVKRIARECGVAPGIHVATPQRAGQMIDQGYQFISIASDAAFMATAAASAMKQIRERAITPPVGLEEKTPALTTRQGY
jgi:hypothetical protein